MRNNILTCLVFFALAFPLVSGAQSKTEMLSVAVCVPNTGYYASFCSVLESRLNLMVTQNGITGNKDNPRFVLYPTVSVLDIQRTSTPPVMTIVQLQINLYIADYLNDNRFASTSFIVKGSGQSEEKAYIDAVKKINNNDKVQAFIYEGKQRICSYYDTMCDKIIKEAMTMAQAKHYEDAMCTLISIPPNASCFEESHNAMMTVYDQFYRNNCEHILQLAKVSYANRDMEEALMYISDIPSDCSCNLEVELLYHNIISYIDNQEMQNQQIRQVELEREQELRLAELEWEREKELLHMGLSLLEYQNNQYVQNKKEQRAYEVIRILAKNSISIMDGSAIRDYVNSQI